MECVGSDSDMEVDDDKETPAELSDENVSPPTNTGKLSLGAAEMEFSSSGNEQVPSTHDDDVPVELVFTPPGKPQEGALGGSVLQETTTANKVSSLADPSASPLSPQFPAPMRTGDEKESSFSSSQSTVQDESSPSSFLEDTDPEDLLEGKTKKLRKHPHKFKLDQEVLETPPKQQSPSEEHIPLSATADSDAGPSGIGACHGGSNEDEDEKTLLDSSIEELLNLKPTEQRKKKLLAVEFLNNLESMKKHQDIQQMKVIQKKLQKKVGLTDEEIHFKDTLDDIEKVVVYVRRHVEKGKNENIRSYAKGSLLFRASVRLRETLSKPYSPEGLYRLLKAKLLI